MNRRPIRIANVSGFYGDRFDAFAEMLATTDDLDVITGDYLAELTMLILAKAQRKAPDSGYAHSFLQQLELSLQACLERGIRVVVNAGGLNPKGLADAITSLAAKQGMAVRVGTVDGDDVREHFAEEGLVTANAYLGGFGIARCLEAGADIVVTGRVTDAALVVGPAVWWHGWSQADLDPLAASVVAGHIIECGPQATGGNYCFPEEILDHRYPGYPIAEVGADGTTIITKPQNSGGLVSVGTVTAQLLYEIQGPDYANPDVTARFDTIKLRQSGLNRVEVRGVRGESPPPNLKVAVTTEGGWRNEMTLVFTGLGIEAKIDRAVQMLDSLLGGFDSFDDYSIQRLNHRASDEVSNPFATVQLRVVVKDRDRSLVDRRFSNAVTELLLASYAGAFTTTPPGPARAYGVYQPRFIDPKLVHHTATLPDGTVERIEAHPVQSRRHSPSETPSPTTSTWTATQHVPLGSICGARSGDKGGNANVGLWVRSEQAYAWLSGHFSCERLVELLPEADGLQIHRHEFPNLWALNFVIHGLLDDGVASTTRFDPQAKGLGEFLRSRFIEIPSELLGDEG